MGASPLAENYARAVFEKAVEKYTRDLHGIQRALEQSKLVMRLDNPAEPFDGKKALLNGLIPAQTDPEVRNLAFLLASKNELHLLGAVVEEFDRIVAQGAPGTLARITTTIELSPEDKARLESKLRARFGKDLMFEYRIDPAIVGGVVVRVGDVVIDGSVVGKLASMKQRMETAR